LPARSSSPARRSLHARSSSPARRSSHARRSSPARSSLLCSRSSLRACLAAARPFAAACMLTTARQLAACARSSSPVHRSLPSRVSQPPPTQQRGSNAVGCRPPAARRIAVSAAPNPAATEARTPSAADHLRRGASPCQPHPTQQRGSKAVGCRSPLRGAAHRRVSRTQPGSEVVVRCLGRGRPPPSAARSLKPRRRCLGLFACNADNSCARAHGYGFEVNLSGETPQRHRKTRVLGSGRHNVTLVDQCDTSLPSIQSAGFGFTLSSRIDTDFPEIFPHAATSPRVTASHPNSEVKLGRAEVVLSWGTRWEGSVLHVVFVFTDAQMFTHQ
jgi:hypothetical protein